MTLLKIVSQKNGRCSAQTIGAGPGIHDVSSRSLSPGLDPELLQAEQSELRESAASAQTGEERVSSFVSCVFRRTS